MTNTIPAVGYTLNIESWENDADFCRTQSFHGLSEVDVRFLLALAQLFRSMNNHSNPGLAGGCWHWEGGYEKWVRDIASAYDAVYNQFKDAGVTPSVLEQFTIDPDWIEDPDDVDQVFDAYYDVVSKLVGIPQDEYHKAYIRVYDSFTVLHYSVAPQDVTEQFA